MPFRLCSRAPTISIAGSSMRADTAARARAGAEPSSIPARRGGERGKRDPGAALRAVSPARESRYGPGVTGRAELPHGRVLLGGIVALALAVHLVGIRNDLPYTPEIDEPLVVNAAVRIGALIDTDPGWFGHPASTLIYSLAGVYRLWSVVAYHGPLVGRDPRLMDRFLAHSGEFYLLGRLLNVAFALAALPLLWAVGRRAFDDAAGLVAAWFVSLSPLAVEHAQMVRSDTSAAFFGLLALWLCLRCHEQPRLRRHVVAGLGIGLA